MKWQIARDALQTALRHTAAAHPEEACGLLLGHNDECTGNCVIIEARTAKNLSPEPDTSFEIDPAALFRAHRAARQGGPQLLGYYHSHPNGALQPSSRDAERAAPDGKLWMIMAGGGFAAYLAGTTGMYNRFLTISLHETEG